MTRIARTSLFTLAALAAVAATGCTSLPTFDWVSIPQPGTQVTAVQVVDQSDEGARLEVTVDLRNFSEVALPLVASQCTLTVAGVGRYTFAATPNRTLPGDAHQTIVIPLAVNTSGRSVAGAHFSVEGSVTYEPPGEIRKLLTETGLPLPDVSFRGDGQVQTALAKRD